MVQDSLGKVLAGGEVILGAAVAPCFDQDLDRVADNLAVALQIDALLQSVKAHLVWYFKVTQEFLR